MEKVYSTQEAMNWFLSHHEGSVIAVRKDGVEKECESYPEVEQFLR